LERLKSPFEPDFDFAHDASNLYQLRQDQWCVLGTNDGEANSSTIHVAVFLPKKKITVGYLKKILYTTVKYFNKKPSVGLWVGLLQAPGVIMGIPV